MPIMIWIAMIIMLALSHWIDFAILTAIQFINAFLGWYETVKAADAVAALKASLKPLATVKRDGAWQNMDAALVVPGDMVLLAAGSSVPADCLVNHGVFFSSSRPRRSVALALLLPLLPCALLCVCVSFCCCALPLIIVLCPPQTTNTTTTTNTLQQAASRSTSRR